MSGFTCASCKRVFGGLTGFDKHQSWYIGVYGTMQLACHDPATLKRKNGAYMFKQDDQGRWVLLVGKVHPHA